MQTPSLLLMVVVTGGVALGASDAWTTLASPGAARADDELDVERPSVTVVLRSSDTVLTADRLGAIAALVDQLQALEDVQRVHGPTTLRRPRRLSSGAIAWTRLPRQLPRAPLERSAWRARVLRDPLLVPRALSADGRQARIEVIARSDASPHDLHEQVRGIVDAAPFPGGLERAVLGQVSTDKVPVSALVPTLLGGPPGGAALAGVVLLLLLGLCTRSPLRLAVCLGLALLPWMALFPVLLDDPPVGLLSVLALPSVLGWVVAMLITAPVPRAPGLSFASMDGFKARVGRPAVVGAVFSAAVLTAVLGALTFCSAVPAPAFAADVVAVSAWVVLCSVGLALLWRPARLTALQGCRRTSRLSRAATGVVLSTLLLAPVALPRVLRHSGSATSPSASLPPSQTVSVTLEGPVGWLDEPGVAQRLAELERCDGLPASAFVLSGPGTLLARVAAAIAELPEGRLAPLPDEPEALRALWELAEDHPDLGELVDPQHRKVTWELDTAARTNKELIAVAQQLREALSASSAWGPAPPHRVLVGSVGLAAAQRADVGRRVAVAATTVLVLLLSLAIAVVEMSLRRWPYTLLTLGLPAAALALWDASNPSMTWTLVVGLGIQTLIIATSLWRQAGIARRLAQQGLSPHCARLSTRTTLLCLEIVLPLVAVATTVALIATPLLPAAGLASVALATCLWALAAGALGPVGSGPSEDRPHT